MKRRQFIKTAAIGTAGIGLLRMYACEPRIDRFSSGRYCVQPGAEIPVIADVDVLLAGGTLGGVVAAISAAKQGARVFLVVYQPYMGEDLCGTYRHMFNQPDTAGDPWLEKLLPPKEPPTPMRIKTKLEKESIDNFPLPDNLFAEALVKIGNDFEGLEILFSDTDRGKTYLERLLQQNAPGNDKLHAAIALGVLGIDAGWNLIAGAIDAYDTWDEGWNFTGMGQFGFSLSRLDTMVIALGRCRRREALPTILAKAEILAFGHHFSHYRAVCMAIETMAGKQAAPVLFRLLNAPGVSGHHVITKTDAVRATVPSHVDVTLRNNALRELHLARALYRCGDHYGLGKQILEKYANDLHGHYFRHAAGVLGMMGCDKTREQ